MQKVEFMFSLGEKVTDVTTGFSGIIIRASMCLNGCIQYAVQPKVSEKEPDKMPENYWIDEQSLKKSGEGIPVKIKNTGGPTTKGPSQKVN